MSAEPELTVVPANEASWEERAFLLRVQTDSGNQGSGTTTARRRPRAAATS
jgi:hypothetical protein